MNPEQGNLTTMKAMNQPDIQKGEPEEVTAQWLYMRGYTVRQAAKAINRSATHVHYVIAGKRKGPATAAALRKLPRRPLCLRAR